jgi:nucleotide-binding universal stress UspA family protein
MKPFAPRRILVPVDFSECARASLDVAVDLARRFDAEIEALHVWETPTYVTPELMLWAPDTGKRSLAEFARTQAGHAMQQLLASVEKSGARVHGRVDTGAISDVILAAAADADLVVIGTHGRTGIAHALLGSVAERVVRRSPCPVLTVRAPAVAAPSDRR